MSIRRQSIISAIIVYIGFALAMFNTYLFAKGFSEAQYGLVGMFIAVAAIMMALSNLGMMAYIYKFFPYYNDNLPPKKNDMMTLALVVSLTGFLFVVVGGLVFKDFVIKKYATNSPELIDYYYWLFPFGFGLSLFSLLEAVAWQFRKSVMTNFLKEVGVRVLTTVLIVLLYLKVLPDFDLFIKIYAFTYPVIALTLLGYLVATKKLHLTFTISRVTRKFYKKIVLLALFLWSGGLVFNLAQVLDTLIIGAVVKNGLAAAGVYSLAQNMSNLIQAPQRAIISAAIPPLSQAWKDKDYAKIDRIYQRSSINQLIFAIAMFSLIWLNFIDGVVTFHLKAGYLDARGMFLFLGLMRVVDLGTGLNSQIIGTSGFWRFEFISGIILLAIMASVSYVLTKMLGPIGPAIGNLVSALVYNSIRYTFLLKRFNMQPFTRRTLYTVLLGVVCFAVCFFFFDSHTGFGWIALRSATFITMYMAGVFMLDLSPDALPVLNTVKKRIGL